MKKLISIVLAVVLLSMSLGMEVVMAIGPTIYTDESSWASAVGPYETEYFDDATLNTGVSVVTDNGTVQAGAYMPGMVWWDRLTCPTSGETLTIWTFDAPIDAFGATWNLAEPGGPGASIEVEMNGSWTYVGEIPNTTNSTFWGFTSTTPFTQIRLSSGTTCNGAWTETYEKDNMVYSFVPLIEVEKDYRYTDVCFERDNDLDGLFNEDPMDEIDNDLDGLIDEDDVDCPLGTYLGTLLPMDAEDNYQLEAVVKKNGKVSSYNPGQYYAVSTVNVLVDVDELTIEEDWSDCCNISALNPKKGGGRVVIVEIRGDGEAYQILDANMEGVTVTATGATAVLEDVPAGTTILMYVKFGPAQKHGDFDPGTCENYNTAFTPLGESTIVSADATLELIEKVPD